MSKRLKRWTIAVAALLCLPPAALVLAAALVEPDRFKPRVEAVVADQTGRTLAIDGPIRIAWSLRPTLSIAGVRLSNLPGGSRPDMATVERIDARLSLPALLRWKLAISRLTLIGPNILFEPVDGTPNWVFNAKAGASPRGGSSPALLVETAHIQNGMVTFRFPDRTNVVGLRTLDYAHRRWRDPLRLDAVLVYRDFKPFSFHASSTPTGGTLDPWTTELEARAFDAVLRANGETSLAGPFDLSLSLRTPALEQLNQLLPSMQLPALHGMVLKTRLSSPSATALPTPGETDLAVARADLGDRVPGLVLSAIRLTLPQTGAVAALSAQGRYRTQPFSLAGHLDMPTRLDGRSTQNAVVAVTTEPGPAGAGKPGDRITLSGKVSLDGGAFAGFEGDVSLRSAALAAFRPVSSPALPPLTDLTLSAGLVLPATMDRIRLRHLALHAAEGDLDGEAQLQLDGDHAATAELHSGRLSLDPLLPATTPDAKSSFSTAPLPWDALRNKTIDLSWRADAIDYRGQSWPAIRLHAVLARGALRIDLPDGAVQGSVAASAGTAPPRGGVPMRVSLRAAAFPLRPLAGLAGLPAPAGDPVTGTLRFEADLSSRGDTPAALAATLNGSVVVATAGAGMSYAALSSFAAPALQQLGARAPRDNHVSVRCFGVHADATDGVVKLSSLALDTGGLVLSGRGEIDLAKRTVALKLHPLARLAGSRVSVPVVVQGSFDAPTATLDANGLDKVGLLIDALFGGDHPKPCAAD